MEVLLIFLKGIKVYPWAIVKSQIEGGEAVEFNHKFQLKLS